MIEWKDDYSIGVKDIDDQHKKLFSIANRAYELLNNDFYDDKYDHITSILAELKDYAIYHFDYEEKYMERIGYPKFFLHRAEHRNFINKVNTFDLDDIDEGQDEYILQLLDFVVNWISNHILKRDKQIVTDMK